MIKEYKRSEEEEQQLGKEIAARFSEGKVRHDLIPPFVLDELAKVYTYGTIKYDDENYLKGLKWKKDVIGPMLRHLWKWIRGERIDEESGCNHMAMVLWQGFTLMVYDKFSLGMDDRCPYFLDLMDKKEQEKRIRKWLYMARNNKLKEYDGLKIDE
jgi:hypothetical protein